MLKRPNVCAGRTFPLRNKFNGILEERIKEDGEECHLIMSIDVLPVDFDLTGNLTSAGKITFWKEVNRAVQKLDENKISLKPRGTGGTTLNEVNAVNYATNNIPEQPNEDQFYQPSGAFKLPTPPPIQGVAVERQIHERSRSRHRDD